MYTESITLSTNRFDKKAIGLLCSLAVIGEWKPPFFLAEFINLNASESWSIRFRFDYWPKIALWLVWVSWFRSASDFLVATMWIVAIHRFHGQCHEACAMKTDRWPILAKPNDCGKLWIFRHWSAWTYDDCDWATKTTLKEIVSVPDEMRLLYEIIAIVVWCALTTERVRWYWIFFFSFVIRKWW